MGIKNGRILLSKFPTNSITVFLYLGRRFGDMDVGDGIDATVWDPRCVRPLDEAMLDDAGRHRLVVTVEDGFREGGFGGGVLDALSQRAPDARVAVLGVPVAHHAHGPADELLASFGLDGPGVAASVRGLLS